MEPLDPRETVVRLVMLVCPVPLELLVPPELSDLLVLVVLLALLELVETRERPVRLEREDTRDTADSPECLDFLVCPDPTERWDLLVPAAPPDPEDLLDLLDPPERMA